MNEQSIAKLIQMHCDGELSPDEHAALQRHLEMQPELQAVVQRNVQAHEKLRERVNGAMASKCPCCPDAIRASIEASLARPDADAGDESADRGLNPLKFAPTKNMASRSLLERIFGNPQRANVLAVAATLALVAGAVLYGVFGPNIDQLRQNHSVDLLAAAAVFAENEHSRCAGDSSVAAQSTPIKITDAAAQDLGKWIGQPVRVFDLKNAGYEFVGAGHCDMPLPAPSGHLLYRHVGPDGARVPMASVFVLPNTGGCHGLCEGKTPGRWYEVKGAHCHKRVLQSTDGKCVYLLVCCVDRDVDNVAEHIALAANVVPPAHVPAP